MARDSFIFYRSFYEAIKEIPVESQLKVYDAISRYALNQEEIELEGTPKAIFYLIKPQLDANFKKYINGSKPKANNKQKESKMVTNENDNENDNVIVNDNNKASDSCVDGLQEVIRFYNNNIGVITPFGLEVLESYVRELDKDIVIYAMQISVEANKRTIQYIKAILNNWHKAGIKTLVQAKEESKKKNTKISNKQNFNNYEQREYNNLDSFYAN